MVMQGATAAEAATALISPAVKLFEFAGVTGGEGCRSGYCKESLQLPTGCVQYSWTTRHGGCIDTGDDWT